MSRVVHKTHDCGQNRKYTFRPLHGNTLNFHVKAGHDANICLTTGPHESHGCMFEIFIGGWGGHDSGMRKDKCHDICRERTSGILCHHEFRGFWLVANKHAIKVGREGESKPFLCYKDHSRVMHFTHYGFCTAYGAHGEWSFDDEHHHHHHHGGRGRGRGGPRFPNQPGSVVVIQPPPPPTFPGQPPMPPMPSYPGQPGYPPQPPPPGYYGQAPPPTYPGHPPYNPNM